MITILNANSLHIPLADKSVHCIVTSPPYWGLRDYGTASWVGGDPECTHEPTREWLDSQFNTGTSVLGKGHSTQSAGGKVKWYKRDGSCRRCGAKRVDAQLGSERVLDCLGWATGKPCGECYVCHMVQVARECWRILRDEGTYWLNLGDSYNGSGGAGGDYNEGGLKDGQPKYKGRNIKALKPKDLCMVPARVAMALQADGWYLRSDIIWHKPNPMPESVSDRPTKSHEYFFLLAKSPKYFYDRYAILETAEWTSQHMNPGQGGQANEIPGDDRNTLVTGQTGDGHKGAFSKNGKVRATMKNMQYDGQLPQGMHKRRAEGLPEEPCVARNRRDVWSVTLHPYSGAHFATYPLELVEPCIKAGTSEKGVCPKCGSPWKRVTKKGVALTSGSGKSGIPPKGKNGSSYEQAVSGDYDIRMGPQIEVKTLGWEPTCDCGIQETVPAIVFDPFSGSGTTLMVARALGRSGVGLDLSFKYIQECARERLGLDALQEWETGIRVKDNDLSDLPMFAGISV